MISKKVNTKTEKNEDCFACHRPLCAPYSSVFVTESNPVTNHSSKNRRDVFMHLTSFFCVICPELLHSYHNCNVDSLFVTDEKF